MLPEFLAVFARKSFALFLASSLLWPASQPLPSSKSAPASPNPWESRSFRTMTQIEAGGRYWIVVPMRLVADLSAGVYAQAQEPTRAAEGQEITLAENGNPIAAADVALVLANMNKVSLGKTDAQGKTKPAPDLTGAAPGNPALNLANLGKVELHAEVDECASGVKQVYLVGPGGQLPPPSKNCKRHRLAGSFFWGQAAQVLLDLGLGTVTTAGRPTSPQQVPAKAPAATPKNTPVGANQQPVAQAGQQPAAQVQGGAQAAGAGQQPGQTQTTGGQSMPPGAVPLADEATRAMNKALDEHFGRKADQIPGNKDPGGIQRSRVDKQALVMVQDIYMRDLTNYSAWIANMAAGNDAEIDKLLDRLEKDREGVSEAYSKMQWASSGFNPLTPDHSAGAEKSRYEALLRDAAYADAHGDPQRATMLRQFAKDSPWGEFLPFQRRFYEALDKNPLLGIQIKGFFSNGDYLFNVLRNFRTDSYNTNAEVRAALRKVIRGHLQAFREQTEAERDRISKFENLEQYWELAGPRYARQQEKAAQMGPFAQSLMNALLGAQEGFAASNAVDEGWKNFWISVVVAGTSLIPVVGPFASAGIQLYHDGSDLVIAYLDNANVENASGVLGYVQRIDSAERLSDAKFRTMLAAAMFLPTVPGAVADLRKVGIKIVHRATAATKVGAEAESAATAARIGTEAPKGVPETPGWAPGREPINEAQAEQMLRDFVAHQDKVGGVQEVAAEIALARKAGVSEDKIKQLTATLKPGSTPLQNQLVATNLMEARLQQLGFDLTMTQEEFNALQGISVRANPKGAGLTQADYDFLRQKLAADPKYLEKLPQRGYMTDFNKDHWNIHTQPQEGFIAGLDAESAANIQKSFQRWTGATEASPMLNNFENSVRNKVPVEQLKDQVMALKADPQAMRSLKNAPNEVKDAFNAAEMLVYKQHDDAVVNFVKNTKLDKQGNPAPWAKRGVEVKVDDFRTPGGISVGVNTDRDYRILYKDPEKGWLEVPKEYWQNYSTEQFAIASGYSPEKLRQIASPEDIAAWQTWDPAKHHGESVEQAMQDKWKELHQQLGTDKYHPEASVEFSDQGVVTGQQAQVNANIKAVKNGDALLKDAEGFGMMYNEKADAYLRLKSAIHPGGDTLEAMAQLNKGIDMLNDVRAGYGKFFGNKGMQAPLSALPDNFQLAAKAIQKLGPFDKTITVAQIKEVEDLLRSLGFAGQGNAGDPLRGFIKALDGQFEVFKTIRPPSAVTTAGAGAAAGGAGNVMPGGAPANAIAGANAGPAIQGGANAINTAVNAGAGAGKSLGTCASGKKKLNRDQYDRMRILLLMQAQGVTPRDPSSYADLPPVAELDPTEQNSLAQDMTTGAFRARDVGNPALEKVYEGLATKLNWGADSKTTMNNRVPGGPAIAPAGGANAIGAGAALGKDIRPGDYVAMSGIVHDYVTSKGLNPDGWTMNRNPGGSVTYTSADGKTSFTAAFQNGQITIQPASANAAGAGAPAGGAGQPIGGTSSAGGGTAVGKDLRPGDYTSMDAIVRDFLKSKGQNPDSWKKTRNPGGSVTYTSPDGKTSFTTSFQNGQILVQPAGANAVGGGAPAAGAGQPAGGGATDPGGASGATPQAPCPEAEQACAAEQEAYDSALAAYDATVQALLDAVSRVEATGPELSAAGAAAGALNPGAPGYAEAQARLTKAKADDQAAVDQQTKCLQDKEAANAKLLQAEENLKKCLDAAAEKCRKKTVAGQPPAENGGQNAIGGGAASGGKAGVPGGANAGGQPNGGNSVGGGTPSGTNPSGPGGAATAPGAGPTGGNVIGGGAMPGAAKTCKHSDEECADLGRIAAEKQLEALHARDDVSRVSLLLAQADLIESQAHSYLNTGDSALENARLARNRGDAAAAAASTETFHTYQAKGTAALAEAAALRANANGAVARADAAEAAALAAWKQYNDCLHLPPCPQDTNATPAGGNVIGGGASGGAVNVTGGAGGGSVSFGNCPKAKEQLDEAKQWHMQAAIDMARMQQAIMSGDSQAAGYLQNSVALDERFALNHERQAAYELAECNKKKTAAMPGGANPAIPGGATTPAPQPQPAPGANSVGGANSAPVPAAGSGASTPRPAQPPVPSGTNPPAAQPLPPPANSVGGGTSNVTPGGTTAPGGANATPGNSAGTGAPPPEGSSSACIPGNDSCTNPSQCTTDPSCTNIKDICKTSPNACSNNSSGESPYQLMMTASTVVPPKSSRLQRAPQFVPAAYHPARGLDPLPAETLLAEMPAQDDKGKNLEVSLVATGNSSGEAFQLQMRDPSGKTKRVAMPEGVVLEPVKPGSAKPPAASGTSGLLTQQIGGFCVQFMKLPPALGMVYKIAGPTMQQKFQPMRLVLQAGRALAEKGKLHPDSDPPAYADSIRQYSVWAQQEGWDEKKFGDSFVERTRKNAEVKKVKWSQQIESALRGAVPGRWRDITQVLDLARAWEGAKTSPQQ